MEKIKGEYCMRNKKRIFILAAIIAIAIFGFASCGGGGDEEFTVTFNLEGGNIDGNTASVGITVNSGEKIANLPAPKKTDCTFGGWFSEKNGNGNAFTENTPVSANITVYAKWLVEQSKPVDIGIGKTMTVKFMALPGADDPAWWSFLEGQIKLYSPSFGLGNYVLTVIPESMDGFVTTRGTKTATVGETFLLTKTEDEIDDSLFDILSDWYAG
jgi:uncharacterized repeat protein (TIGR02543 family)